MYGTVAQHRLRLLAVGVPGVRLRRRRRWRHLQCHHQPRADEAGYRLVDRERRHSGLGSGRRQHRHPLVQRGSATRSGCRSTSAPPQTICQVTLNWETAYGVVIPDPDVERRHGVDDIYSTTTGTGGVQNLTVTGSGRYVRMYGTVRHTVYGYSLWEMSVYGTRAPAVAARSRAAARSARTSSCSTRPCPAPRSRASWTRSSPPRSRTSSAPSGTRCCSSRAPTAA